jgi:hypothetical protein
MLSLASDFWLWFWVILGAGAAVTVALALAIALLPARTGHPRLNPSSPPPWHPERLPHGQDHGAPGARHRQPPSPLRS